MGGVRVEVEGGHHLRDDASWAISQTSASSREEGEDHREKKDNSKDFRWGKT